MSNWINLVFVVDKSGSMCSSKEAVVNGFSSVIEEQRKNTDGRVTVSLFTFSDNVHDDYLGKDIDDIGKFVYEPDGLTALNDGIGHAIDRVGEWLYERDINKEEMPQKTLVVVMTDGMENNSKDYTLEKVQEMIKHQTDVYSWEFVYIGTDITTKKPAMDLGIKNAAYTSKKNISKAYNFINSVATCYRRAFSSSDATRAMTEALNNGANSLTLEYENDLGRKITT